MGVLTVGLANLPEAALGELSLTVAGTESTSGAVEITPMGGSAIATAVVEDGNAVSWTVCPPAGCPVTANFAASAYSVTEGETVDVAVELSEALIGRVTVPVRVRTGQGAGTAPASAWTLSSDSVTFLPDETRGIVTVTAVDNPDDAADDAEELTLVLEFGALPPSVEAGATTATTVTIHDDDVPAATVAFGAAAGSATEGGTPATVTVTLTPAAPAAAPERAVTIPLAVELLGGASAGDYGGLPESVTFAADASGAALTRTLTIEATDDEDRDSGESIVVGGTTADGFSVTPAEITLTDNDTATLSIAAPGANAVEGGAAEFVVTLSASVDAETTVAWSASDGAASASADLEAASGAVTFPAGAPAGATAALEVGIANDDISEGAETFTVTLDGVTGDLAASISVDSGNASAEAVIAANDPLEVALDGPAEAREGTAAIYTVSLGGGVGSADVTATVILDSAASSADADDFTGLPATVTVPAGRTSATFSLDILREEGGAREGPELLVLKLDPASVRGGGGGGVSVRQSAGSVETTIVEIDLEQRGLAMKLSLAAFGRTVAANTVETIEDRAAAGARPSDGWQAAIGGESLSAADFRRAAEGGAAENDGLAALARSVTRLLGASTDAQGGVNLDPVAGRDLAAGSAFRFSLDDSGEGTGGGAWTLWGRGAATGFEGAPERGFTMNGDVLSGYVGIDVRAREDLLAGVAVSRSAGETDYRFAVGTEGRIDTALTGVHPYVHWSPGSGLGIFATLGWGKGDATLDDGDSDAVETPIEMRMAAVGAR